MRRGAPALLAALLLALVAAAPLCFCAAAHLASSGGSAAPAPAAFGPGAVVVGDGVSSLTNSSARAAAPAAAAGAATPACGGDTTVEAAAASAAGAQAAAAAARAAATRAAIHAHNQWKNDLVLSPLLPPPARAALPRPAQAWLRNYLLAAAICVLPGAAWALTRAAAGGAPLGGTLDVLGSPAVRAQLLASFRAIPAVALLPTAVEAAAEAGWTRAYFDFSDVPLPLYCFYVVLYMLGVEYGVYRLHRAMHSVPLLYRHVHCVHHAFNKEHTMSPFAGLAVHSLDGIAQALPYALLLLVVPMHYITYEALLGLSSLWAANTHDNVHGGVPFVLGARYHTIHHTTYRHNYGQYLVLMDWLHGTLVTPEAFDAQQKAGGKAAKAE